MMTAETNLFECLDEIKLLLEEEQRLIMSQNGEALEAMAKHKTELTRKMNKLLKPAEMPEEMSGEFKNMIRHKVETIKQLQETNALLARQTLVYLGALKEALTPQGAVPNSGMYAKSGEVNKSQAISSSWLDQSI
jgi:hypothetical protein